MSKLQVRTIERLDSSTDEIIPKFTYRFYDRKSIKHYIEYSYLLLTLSSSELSLLMYLVQMMNRYNVVINNFNNRSKFIKYHKKILSEIRQDTEEYKDVTIKLAYSSLVKKGILSNIKRGYYRVSPLLWYAGSEEERAEVISKYLEETGESLRPQDIISKEKDFINEN